MTDAGTGRLAGRKLMVTGAASGIGLATSRLFIAEGAQLAVLDRDAGALARELDQPQVSRIACDLIDGDRAAGAVHQAAAALGGLDGIVNCAGVALNAPLGETGPDVWRRIMAINLDAPYRICREALPYLQAARAATIVNVASGQALLPNAPGGTAYAASKAGLVAFTKAIAAELAPAIRANILCPGLVNTPMVRDLLREGDGKFVEQYAMRRPAEPAEMAKVLLFLTSDESSYVTGATLAADGGRTFH
jgi:NAD(P)-dependent dehydrogenase (short-subunit alcohol dehydrogenase family)